MPWEYSQSTGRLTWNGRVVGNGYSGSGIGRNNADLEDIRNVGPIPRGRYAIGSPRTHPNKGPVTMSLTPVGHAAHNRTAFLIHGDSIANPGNASQGCIILPRNIRGRIATSGDLFLQVVE